MGRGPEVRRILICGVQTLFVQGGAEVLVGTLKQELQKRGYAVDVVSLPFKDVPRSEILKGFLLWRWLHLLEMHGQPVDMVIATKFPSYAARHPNKVVWLVHQHRQAYELYGTPYSDMHLRPDGQLFRWLVRWLDKRSLSEAKALFAISRNTAARLKRYNGLEAETLYPPPKLSGCLRTDGYGDYLLAVGRLEPIKRFDLIVRAVAQTHCGARCIIAGDGLVRRELEQLAAELGVADRVRFVGRVQDRELVDLYAGCFGVLYPPYDEDYGYVTVESFLAQKPVITTDDAGGVLEFVADEETGYVVPPEPQAIAEKIDLLYGDRELCRRLGQAGFARVGSISWDRVIDRLTQGL